MIAGPAPHGQVPAGDARPRATPAWLLVGLAALTGCRPTEAARDPRAEPASAPLTLDRPAPRASSEPEASGAAADPIRIVVDCSAQRLELLRGDTLVASYPVSTSSVGLGSEAGSNRTPLGRHRVAQKFGAGAPVGAVFHARRPTGEIAEILTDATDLEQDLVLTRILWLEGLEPGVNRGAGVDSKRRCIYIHGTNEEGLIGRPASHGCLRMTNRAVVELFEQVPVGTEVRIVE